MLDTGGMLLVFGPWLRDQLARREWTPAEFSRRVGASTGRISEWLNGKHTPSPGSCDRIADVLGVDVDLVLTLAGHRPQVEPLAADDPAMRIITLVRRVDWTVPDRREQIEDTLERWAKRDRTTRKDQSS